VIYLDSGALVKLVIAEKETDALGHYLDGRWTDLVSSELALTEVVRVVRRSCYTAQRHLVTGEAVLAERMAAATDLLDRIDLVVLDTEALLRAALFEDDPHVGSLDALHLVSARSIGAELAAFVTYDRTLGRAAARCGLPLVRPE
jgi:predicted nucleic acid-binding protein